MSVRGEEGQKAEQERRSTEKGRRGEGGEVECRGKDEGINKDREKRNVVGKRCGANIYLNNARRLTRIIRTNQPKSPW